MSAPQMMAILLPILALVLLGFFAAFWLKDRNRNQEEAHDPARLETDTDGRGTSGARR